MNVPSRAPVVATTTQLHTAALAGSEAAWLALVERYGRLVWKVVRGFRLSQAAAEDVVQLTWLRLVEHLDAIREPESLGGWLSVTARNEALAALRRNKRVAPMRDSELEAVSAWWHDADELVANEERSIVRRAFASLGAADQRLLVLIIADPPLSYVEIGEVLDRPIGSIGPSRSRAIARLRRALEAEQSRRGVAATGG